MNIRHLSMQQPAGLHSHHSASAAITRRHFLKAGATAALAIGSGLARPHATWAAPRKGTTDPRPIPYGTQFLGPDGPLFHVQPPGYPIPGLDTDPATNDPSTITDFNGFVGLVYVGGQGTHYDRVTRVTKTLYWEVDLRFMVGTYVGKDGRKHDGTFGFV